jgi:putative transposase
MNISVRYGGHPKDHVHPLAEPLPQTTLSKLVNSLKGVSSRMMRKEFFEHQRYSWKGGLWSPGYSIASCGGAPLEIVRWISRKPVNLCL